ncbi:hypothetical protein KL948_000794 [Ogataea haglerorum]|nr:hypothetical protein KL914_001302 [Ogataea haglerorum]KAG7733592.1 hypothetical protein KL948_000794 [Ogataea haglerorum]KAG7737264.1 hypothetical protein KL932_004224 [Ogataea haglerorum]KAG7746314.1 hypothetical protein KL912_004574 [Ogataea haglerorum]KAG7785161.1 hypothetical protein KL945_003926 [Ogataea haglerorum]
MQVKNRRKVQPSRNAASANENGERLNIADCSTRSLRAAHRGTVPSGREGATAPAPERVYPDSAVAGEELLRCAVPRQDRAIAVFREMASVRRRTAEMQLKNRSDAIARRCRAVIQRLGHPNGSIVTHGRSADLGQQHGHSVDDLQEFFEKLDVHISSETGFANNLCRMVPVLVLPQRRPEACKRSLDHPQHRRR